MKLDWREQTIVITGAYGGLGQEMCKELARLGAHLIISGRNVEKLDELKKSLPKTTVSLAGDVSAVEFHNNLLALLEKVKTDGHILINNAGVSDAHFLSDQAEADMKQMLDINLLAPMLLSKKLLPWLQQAKSAKIINIGSTFGAIGYPGFSSYCATKFGLRGFSQALNRELVDTNISVQYLAPRAIATKINSDRVNFLNDKLKNKVDTPAQLLPQIIQAIKKNKTEKFFGWPEKLFAKINGLFPAIVGNAINKDHQTIKKILTNTNK